MKKYLALIALLAVLVLAACGSSNSKDNGSSDTAESGDENVVLKVGASSTPHAKILEQAVPLLEKEGITLEIEPYEDYVLPNDDLANGDLDANYFQHIPFLEETVENTGYEIESIGGIHVEPMGVYSENIKSVDEIPDGTEVILSNSVADHERILKLFEAEGLITLDENAEEITLDSIVENPKNLEFSPDYAPEILPELYHNEKDTLVVINTNFAVGADLNPVDDALFIEGEESDYVNVIAVRSEDKDNEALNKLVDVLHSEEIANFILDEFDGAIVPVGGSK